MFYEKGLQKINKKKSLRAEKLIKGKGDYVKWKVYGSSFIRWPDKKDTVKNFKNTVLWAYGTSDLNG